jgi:hypothetical protein
VTSEICVGQPLNQFFYSLVSPHLPMTRPSSFFNRRKRVQLQVPRVTENYRSERNHRPHLYRWEVVINASLAVMQLLTLGFLYLAYQTQIEAIRAQEKALTAQQWALTEQVFARLDIHNFEINKFVFENPDVRKFFYGGVQPPTKNDAKSAKTREQIATLAEMYLDFIETFDNDYLRKMPDMELGGKYDEVWKNYFLALFEKSPALCQRYLKVSNQYSPSMCLRYARFSCPCEHLLK